MSKHREPRVIVFDLAPIKAELLAITAELSGPGILAEIALEAWLALLPERFHYREVTGPRWFVEQLRRDMDYHWAHQAASAPPTGWVQ